jgi:hypothetical protein
MTDFYYDTTYTYGMRKESITEDEYDSSDSVSDDEYTVIDDLSQKFENGMKRFSNGMSSVHDELSDIQNKIRELEEMIILSIPIFTETEREHYILEQDKAVFTSPEQEYEWAFYQMKICAGCIEAKRLSEYPQMNAGDDEQQGNTSAFNCWGYRLRHDTCADCIQAYSNAKQRADATQKAKETRKTFTTNDFVEVPLEEPTMCAICNTKETPLVMDHCPTTNTFRGYCCHSCVRSMEVLGDNVEGILRVLNYFNQTENRKIKQTEEGVIVIDYLAR